MRRSWWCVRVVWCCLVLGCLAMGCGGEEGTSRTIDVTVIMMPPSEMERTVLVELFERTPGDDTAEASKLAGQQIVGITARGESRFKVRLQDELDYYFTVKPDPMLRCGIDYEMAGDPAIFRGTNTPTKLTLSLTGADVQERCQ